MTELLESIHLNKGNNTGNYQVCLDVVLWTVLRSRPGGIACFTLYASLAMHHLHIIANAMHKGR